MSFQDVFVPDSRRLGDVGAGWGQNTGELALERGGVDRWMSLMPVLENWAANQAAQGGPAALVDLARLPHAAGLFAGCRCPSHGWSTPVARRSQRPR